MTDKIIPQATPGDVDRYYAARQFRAAVFSGDMGAFQLAVSSLTKRPPKFDIARLNYDAKLITQKAGYISLEKGFAVVTGTGWNEIPVPGEIVAEIPYSEFASFPTSEVSGHAGKLLIRRFGDSDIFEWRGRNHAYQLKSLEDMTPLLAIPYLSSEFDSPSIILTQGVGGIGARPNSYVIVADHIGTRHINLHGDNDGQEIFGSEFTRCNNLYCPKLRAIAFDAFKAAGLADIAQEGVYDFWYSKHFQTPAEIFVETDTKVKFVDYRGILSHETSPACIGKSNVIDTIYSAGLRRPMKVLSVCLVTNPAQRFETFDNADSETASGPDHALHKKVGQDMAQTSSAVMGHIFDGILKSNQ